MTNDEFLHLIARELSGEMMPAESDRLQQILAGSDELRQRYAWLGLFWQDRAPVAGDVKAAFEQILLKINSADEKVFDLSAAQGEKKSFIRNYRSFKKLLAAAAIVAILATSAFLFYPVAGNKNAGILSKRESDKSDDEWVEQKNEKAGKIFIALPDSTKIWLNSGSRIIYNTEFGKGKREIYLAGEAFFDVTHNEKVPMIVHARNIDIRVKGTAFNVNAYGGSNSVETSLIRGLIEVTNRAEPDRKILLKPNEKIVVLKDGEASLSGSDTVNAATEQRLAKSPYLIEKLVPEASTRLIPEISWLENKLVFNHESFEDLAEQMQRWYHVIIRFQDDEVKKFQYTGAFDKEDIRQALAALQLSYHFEFSMHNNEITIRK